MKFLAFLLLLGVASASFHDAFDDAIEEFLLKFLDGMEKAPSLREHKGIDSHFADAVEDEVKTENGKKLKDVLNRILERVKEGIENGKEIKGEFLDKIRELREVLKSLKLDLGDKSKDLVSKIKDRARDYLKKLLDRLGSNKRAADDLFEKSLSELNIRDVLKKIKEHLQKNVDPELLKESIEKILGQGSELLKQILYTLKEKGKNKVMILIDQLLDEDDDRRKRGISDYWEKVKNYFKDLKIDLQEKYMKFGEWVKDSFGQRFENSKDKMDNIRAIANEFARHAKGISKEVAAEAGDFFRNYKDELGIVWDEIKEKINEVMKRKD